VGTRASYVMTTYPDREGRHAWWPIAGLLVIVALALALWTSGGARGRAPSQPVYGLPPGGASWADKDIVPRGEEIDAVDTPDEPARFAGCSDVAVVHAACPRALRPGVTRITSSSAGY